VLPFKPLTVDSRDEVLEVGMADSLIARMSAAPGLVVRSIGSVRRFGGTEQDPLRAARELDVQWILDGTIQRWGNQVRVTAQRRHHLAGHDVKPARPRRQTDLALYPDVCHPASGDTRPAVTTCAPACGATVRTRA